MKIRIRPILLGLIFATILVEYSKFSTYLPRDRDILTNELNNGKDPLIRQEKSMVQPKNLYLSRLKLLYPAEKPLQITDLQIFDELEVDQNIRINPFIYNHSNIDQCEISKISLKYFPECDKDIPKSYIRKLLIVGVQRSGTHYTWEMLNRLGVNVNHEGVGLAGAISWFYAYKSRYYAINNPEMLTKHKFNFVFHQVRHPLRVISSIVRRASTWDRFWAWSAQVEPQIIKSDPILLRAMKMWVSWNKHIEQYADLRFRVEETSPRDVCRLAGFEERLCGSDGRFHTTTSKKIQPIIDPQMPDKVNGQIEDSTDLAVSWVDIEKANPEIAQEIKQLTLKYGYYLDPRKHPQSLGTEIFNA